MNYLIGRPWPVRALCVLLAVFMLWCFFMVPRASAVALEATTVAYAGVLIGTILVGAGVVFSSHGDMAAVGAAMYKSFVAGSSAVADKIGAIASWAVDHGTAAAKGALRVGKELYQEIVDAFNASYSGGSFSIPGNSTFLSSIDEVRSAFEAFNKLCLKSCAITDADGVYWTLRLVQSGRTSKYYIYADGTLSNTLSYKDYTDREHFICLYKDSNKYDAVIRVFWGFVESSGVVNNVGGATPTGIYFKDPGITLHTSVPIAVSIPAGDLVYPSDDYLVKMPDIPSVDSATGDVTYPADAAYTKDAIVAPYPVGDDGVKVPDIPFDVPVDGTTGKALDDTGTADPDAPDTPGEDTGIAGLLGKIIALLTSFFDSPSDFQLNMDGFRNLAIKDKFPFCIPFDMVDSVREFAASAADYQLHIKIDGQYLQIDHTVDLTPFAVPIAFFRYLCVTWFVWVLISRTHDLIKW